MMGSADIHEGIPGVALVKLPDGRDVFSRRAARFRALVAGSEMADYLSICAAMADAQQKALATITLDDSVPGDALLISSGRVPVAWTDALSTLLVEMKSLSLPPPAEDAMRRLAGLSAEKLLVSATAFLAGDYTSIGLAAAPFVGAALQVVWTAAAMRLPVPHAAASLNTCPVCGSAPVAGIVLADSRRRYLVCALCATEWYLPRLTCSACGSTEDISYLAMENTTDGLKAECCGRCSNYLKLLYGDGAPGADPFVDDAATPMLDLLLADEGFMRRGANVYLLPGSA